MPPVLADAVGAETVAEEAPAMPQAQHPHGIGETVVSAFKAGMRGNCQGWYGIGLGLALLLSTLILFSNFLSDEIAWTEPAEILLQQNTTLAFEDDQAPRRNRSLRTLWNIAEPVVLLGLIVLLCALVMNSGLVGYDPVTRKWKILDDLL